MGKYYAIDLKESFYHGAVISALAIGFTMIGKSLEPLPPEPILSNFYVPSEDYHNRLAFITLSMIGIGAYLWYHEK